MTIAFDFDGTIVIEDYPRIGSLLPFAKEVINELYHDGHYIIIWTCRRNEEIVQFLADSEIKYHAINQSHPNTIDTYGYESRKVGADIYVDDRGILGLPHWLTIKEIIKQKAIEYDKREVR